MIRKAFLAAALIALLASLASAQRGGGGGGRGGMGGGGGFPGGGFPAMQAVDKSETIAKELKLSPAQKTEIEAIMDEAQKQTVPIMQQLKDAKQKLLEAHVGGKDPGDVAKTLASINAQVLSIEVDAYIKTVAKLDDKQKNKAPKVFDMMSGMFLSPNWRRTN